MDKINRTLLEFEDFRSRQEAVERKITSCVIDGDAVGDGISFGVIEGKGAAVTAVFEGNYAALVFNDVIVTDGTGPLVAVLSGKGELRLKGNVSKARALVTGAKKINS